MKNELIDDSGLKVGDNVFIFDENRRFYDKNSPEYPGAIYRGHFREVTIDGETKQSWLIGKHNPQKFPKKSHNLYSAKQVDEECWVHIHRHKISRLVADANMNQLVKIAEIIGYKS